MKSPTKKSLTNMLLRYCNWRSRLFTHKRKLALVTDLIYIFTILATFLTIKDSIINWYQRHYESDSAAIEYYRIGEKYYADKKYDDALQNFERVYKINHSLLEIKYYYVMSLLYEDQDKNFNKAEKLLYENSDSLTDSENAVYAMLEYDAKNYSECLNSINKIKDPMKLQDDIFNQYILTLTYINFQSGFIEGQDAVFNNQLLIDRKIGSLGLLNDKEIKKFSEVTINIPTAAVTSNTLYSLRQCAIQMYIYYLNNCMQEKKYEKILPVLEISSQYFEVFDTEENVSKDYLQHVYNSISMFSNYNEDHLNMIGSTIENLVNKLEEGNSKTWGNDLKKCKQIYNGLIDTYTTSWTPYVYD